DFAAFSLQHLHLREVLFSSWHGLFFYHPLMAVAVFWLLRELVFWLLWRMGRPPFSAPAFLIIAIAIFSFFFQVLVQSAHEIWWMGMGTFGARGFAGVSILVVYALLHCRRPASKLHNWILVALAGVAAYEAYLLWMGETNFVGYEDYPFISFLFSSKS